VRWDLHKVGEAAAELLLARLAARGREGGARHVTLPTELVVRASCRAA
jgi:DNA-binding LacI/PurR family transcriptional regulator